MNCSLSFVKPGKPFETTSSKSCSYLEPVDGTAVDEGRELPQSVPEGVSDGGECDDDVKVLLDAVHEEGEHGER